MRVANGIPLGCPLLLPVGTTVYSVQILKDLAGNVGDEVDVRFLYDNLPPLVVEVVPSAQQNPQGNVLLNPFLPKRPFAAAGGGTSSSVVQAIALDMYTQDTTMTFTWNADMTEDYQSNDPTRYMCTVQTGDDSIMPTANCTSPFILDQSTLPTSPFAIGGQTRESEGATVLRDGTECSFLLGQEMCAPGCVEDRCNA
jgi:hypothetical protein